VCMETGSESQSIESWNSWLGALRTTPQQVNAGPVCLQCVDGSLTARNLRVYLRPAVCSLMHFTSATAAHRPLTQATPLSVAYTYTWTVAVLIGAVSIVGLVLGPGLYRTQLSAATSVSSAAAGVHHSADSSSGLFLPYVALVVLSGLGIIDILVRVDGENVRQQLQGSVPARSICWVAGGSRSGDTSPGCGWRRRHSAGRQWPG
jgi:hypothetical protein